MNEAAMKATRKMLEASRETAKIVNGLAKAGFESESLGRTLGTMSDAIFYLYDVSLSDDDVYRFHEVVGDFSDGAYEIEECVERLSRLAESAR